MHDLFFKSSIQRSLSPEYIGSRQTTRQQSHNSNLTKLSRHHQQKANIFVRQLISPFKRVHLGDVTQLTFADQNECVVIKKCGSMHGGKNAHGRTRIFNYSRGKEEKREHMPLKSQRVCEQINSNCRSLLQSTPLIEQQYVYTLHLRCLWKSEVCP